MRYIFEGEIGGEVGGLPNVNTLPSVGRAQNIGPCLMALSEANFRYRLKKFGIPAVRKRG